jgi:osmotically-inducible protein OsmY
MGNHHAKEGGAMRYSIQVAALIAVLALMGGCTRITGRTAGTTIDDANITTQVNTAIVQEPDAHYWKIDVTTTNGAVVLTGYVDTNSAEDRLVGKIKQINGVKSVKSLLRIEPR